jgi:hypothetical protein
MTTPLSLLEVGSGSEAMYRPFNDEDDKIKKGGNHQDSSLSWYSSLRTAVLGNGPTNKPEPKQRKVFPFLLVQSTSN